MVWPNVLQPTPSSVTKESAHGQKKKQREKQQVSPRHDKDQRRDQQAE
jgi:hypothetical protein